MSKIEIEIISGYIASDSALRRVIAMKRDGRYEVEIKEKREKRSLGQNAYFHGVLCPIVLDGLRDAGWDEFEDLEDVKDYLKGLFARVSTVNKKTGEIITRIQKTSKMTTVQFMEFCDKIIKWGAEWLGVIIPYPNEYLKEF